MQSSTAWALQAELHRSSGAKKNGAIRMTMGNGIQQFLSRSRAVWILIRLRRGLKPAPFQIKVYRGVFVFCGPVNLPALLSLQAGSRRAF